MLAATSSMAATVNSVTVTSVGQAGNNCNFAGQVSVTGDTNDGSNNDIIHIGAEDSAGVRRNAPAVRVVGVGQTSTILQAVSYTTTSAVRDTHFYVVRDSNTTATNGFRGSVVGSAAVPRAMLVAAGGSCANIAVNSAPVVNAGPDQTLQTGGVLINLNGSNSTDADGDNLTYQWQQISGPTVNLNNRFIANPTFTTPAASNQQQVIIFELSVGDGVDPVRRTDTVSITTVAQPNTPPTVNAGTDATISAGATINMAGTANDLDMDPLTFQWTQVAGPAVTLNGATTLTPSFVAPVKTASAQVLDFSLIANDGAVNSAPDLVRFTLPANVGPTADAGAVQSVGGGTTVTLDGSASTDGDGDGLVYQWIQTSGPMVTLNNANSVSPTFVAPPSATAVQTLGFSLVVSDGIASSAAATTSVDILANAPPTVNAGIDVTFPGGSFVTLEGIGTDPDGDPLTFQWTQVAGPSVTLADATTLNPNFTAPPKTNAVQVLTFSLVANDGTNNSSPDTVDVTIPPNVGPTANAGPDATVNGGSAVTLDGSASVDGDGDVLTYQWLQTGGPAVTLSGATTVSPTFTAPAATLVSQALTFDLVVSDGLASSTADRVSIAVAANTRPVADAGTDQGPINSGATVTLNGGASSDSDGDVLNYAWTQISGPAVTLSGANTANPTFVAPDVQGTQDMMFQLIVNDGTVDSNPDSVTIGVRGVGTITIIQRVVGNDTSVVFTSDVSALSGAIVTRNGVGQRVANNVAAGNHTISAANLSSAGYALTDISCNDSDSATSLVNRSVAIALSPNENLVCTFTSTNTREAATVAINNFLTGRNALILSHQPNLQRRLDRLQGQAGAAGSATAFGLPVPGSGRLPFSAAVGNDQSRFASSLAMAGAAMGDPDRGKQPFDIWAEAYFSKARLGSQRGNFRIIYTGADYRVDDKLLIGALAEFDSFNNRGALASGESEGNGWMAGPYVMARIAPDLYGEIRAAWGKSDNSVSPLGTFVDDFKTSRAFYSGSMIGQFDIGKNTDVRPEFTVRYISEKAKAYTDSLNIAVPGQTVDQGDISFRPRVQHMVDLQRGWSLRPYGAVEGIYTFGTKANGVINNGLRARLEGGLDLFSASGFRTSLSAFHDGIGTSNYRSTGVHISVSLGF
ncbi:MAG: PKD domain-containing protein [Parasphingorhabdus sp.]|uniref:PKD domain-containing protein n=2 Tax=Parasphingorhabdus sp. TaxID=2709688 RepID=UPI00329966CD